MAATAHNILANEPLYRLAVVGDVISVLYIAYTLLLYYLLRPVNRNLALLGARFSLVGIAVGVLIPLFELAVLVALKDAPSLRAFHREQVQALALLCLKLRAQAYAVSLVLFGTYNVLTGYLIFRSTFLRRMLGVLLAICGAGYLINPMCEFSWTKTKSIAPTLLRRSAKNPEPEEESDGPGYLHYRRLLLD